MQRFLAAVFVACVGYYTLFEYKYPDRRVLSWFEFFTDGHAPKWLTQDATSVTGQLWIEYFHRGFVEKSGALAALVDYIQSSTTDGRADIMELAAGSGVAASLWLQAIRGRGPQNLRMVLTDLQPALGSWDTVLKKEPSISFVNTSVDATAALAAVQDQYVDWGSSNTDLRMIHLALHHLQPQDVKGLFQDAINSDAAVFVGDLAPTLGGVVFNGLLTVKLFFQALPAILLQNPSKILMAPLLPLIFIGMWHDATVSVMRAYSHSELKEIMEDCTLHRQYDIKTYPSASFAQFFRVPAFIPVLQDPVMQFVLLAPSGENATRNCVFYNESKTTPLTGILGEGEVTRNCAFYNESTTTPAIGVLGEGEVHEQTVSLVFVVITGIVGYFVGSSLSPLRRRQRVPAVHTGDLVGKPAILGIATAVPPHRYSTEEQIERFGHFDDEFPNECFEFFQKVSRKNGTEARYSGATLEESLRGVGLFGKGINPDVRRRHEYWAYWAPRLAIEASRKAIDVWGGDKGDITHVVFHSCTGFKAPGVELDIVDALKLLGVKRRLGINYMGCFGGFTGMSVAKAFALAEQGAHVLVCCVELCCAHFTVSSNKSMAIGNAIFSDGASAVIIGPGRLGDWAIGHQVTKTMNKSTRGYMTWAPNNGAYDMYLDKNIGRAFGSDMFLYLKSMVRDLVRPGQNLKELEWCVHPGGRKLLDYFCAGGVASTGLKKYDLRHSYAVLRDYGNMSSPTIFFVIEKMIKEIEHQTDENKEMSAICLGFGPGLTLELAALHRICRHPTVESVTVASQ